MTIITSQAKLFAKVSLCWLSPEQGGRKRSIGTADYAATAYFDRDANKRLFSIILHFPSKIEGNVKVPIHTEIATMIFLAPELVASYLEKGIAFTVTEGARVVARGEVLSVATNRRRANNNSSHAKRAVPRCISLLRKDKIEILNPQRAMNDKSSRIHPTISNGELLPHKKSSKNTGKREILAKITTRQPRVNKIDREIAVQFEEFPT